MGLRGTAGDRQISLNWTNPSNSAITKYQYAQREGDGAWSAWTDIPGSSATTTSYTVTTLTNGTDYYIALRAAKGMDEYDLLSSVAARPQS